MFDIEFPDDYPEVDEELLAIESEIEEVIQTKFKFSRMTPELFYKVSMWIAEYLETEHGMLRPFQLIWERYSSPPVLMIMDDPWAGIDSYWGV